MSVTVAAKSFGEVARQALALLEELVGAEPNAWIVTPDHGPPQRVEYDGRGVRIEVRLTQDSSVTVRLAYHDKNSLADHFVTIAQPDSAPLLQFVSDFQTIRAERRSAQALERGRQLVSAIRGVTKGGR